MSVNVETRLQKSPGRENGAQFDDVLSWEWPIAAALLTVYDKHSDTEKTLQGNADVWEMLVRGAKRTYRFMAGADGALQRKFVMRTQTNRSPSAIEKFTRTLIINWVLYKQMLHDGPSRIRRHWEERVTNVDIAKAGKIVLRFSCKASAGPWRPSHLALIKSLDTHARRTFLAHRGRRKRRESVLDVGIQAALVRVLDEGSQSALPSEQEMEGLAALALFYQFGVRPVQVLALRCEHVSLLSDAFCETACIVSFHAAKQAAGGEFEMPRQVRPEWTAPIVKLISAAKSAGRQRLFTAINSEQLWSRVNAVCRGKAVKVNFTAYALRHTAAQLLADAGHDRKSIATFLGHSNQNNAEPYLRASLQTIERLNAALGISRIYEKIVSLAEGKFVSLEEMAAAAEDQQIGAIVGEKLISGIGLCQTGQPFCRYNPVTSCYGCGKFIPSLDKEAHGQAIEGMRKQVLLYANNEQTTTSPALTQLMGALAGAQQALQAIDERRVSNA